MPFTSLEQSLEEIEPLEPATLKKLVWSLGK